MPNKQLALPGMELTVPSKPKPKPLSIQQQIADLQHRVLKLELETALVRIQVEATR